jgi:hypothetical protein
MRKFGNGAESNGAEKFTLFIVYRVHTCHGKPGKPGKKLLSWNVMEKSWNFVVLEKSWKCHGIL